MRVGEYDRKYDDILRLPHPVSGRRGRMSNADRAAQFSPFAALTGFDAAIAETARLTDRRIELDESGKELLNEKLWEILETIDSQPQVTITHFVYDERKAGGAYVSTTGRVKKIDVYSRTILFTNGTAIPISEILDISFACE